MILAQTDLGKRPVSVPTTNHQIVAEPNFKLGQLKEWWEKPSTLSFEEVISTIGKFD